MIIYLILLLSVLRFAPSNGEVFNRSGFVPRTKAVLYTECDELTDDDIYTNDAPDELDWSAAGLVRPVRNQRKCGSSWAFALIGNIEGQYIKNDGGKVDLSVQELIDCINDCNGCDEFCTSDGALSALVHSAAGIEVEADYPYRNEKPKDKCQFDRHKQVTVVHGCTTYNLKNERNLKEVLYQVGPLYVVVNGTPLSKYTNGILKHCPVGAEDDMTHAVLLTGYGTEDGVDYWIIKNSWGLNWGENGFARIKRGVNACGLMNPEMSTVTLGEKL